MSLAELLRSTGTRGRKRQREQRAHLVTSPVIADKTGGYPEDRSCCPQSTRHNAGVRAEKLIDLDTTLAEARAAKASGAGRFGMGAAWRSPKDRDLDRVGAMVAHVKALGLETSATLGMLTADQALRLRRSDLDYYNHNLDTSLEYYGRIITTRTYRDGLATLEAVRAAGARSSLSSCRSVRSSSEYRQPAQARTGPVLRIVEDCWEMDIPDSVNDARLLT